MKKYESAKRIDGYYMVIERKTCKPVSAFLYSTKRAAQKKADVLNRKEKRDSTI